MCDKFGTRENGQLGHGNGSKIEEIVERLDERHIFLFFINRRCRLSFEKRWCSGEAACCESCVLKFDLEKVTATKMKKKKLSQLQRSEARVAGERSVLE